jgi:glyoxylase-like metal-dependent hydrolase (beta-lactamase superfamily II)
MAESKVGRAAGFQEVADRVWVSRRDWFDLNVTLVRGSEGLVVVDTHASAVAARAVIDDIAQLGLGPVTRVVNTHEHFDHTFGNGAFLAAYDVAERPLPVHAHDIAAANTVSAGERIKQLYRDEPDEPHRDEVLETEIVPATVTFSSVAVLDLGDRQVELIHPGRGHTAGDLVVRVADADVLLAGDLVEESAPPGYGVDCHPMDWPLTLDLVLGLIGPETVVVPGHGALVGREFVEEQRTSVGIVAETIRDLAGRGVPLDQALATGDWPFPADHLANAVRRGYADLPTSQRRLPLV